MGSDYHLVSGGRKFIHGFSAVLTNRLVSRGLKFIHGFNGVLTTLWYHQTCLPSDEFEKTEELIIASM